MPIRPETLLRDAEGRLQPPQELLARIERAHPRVSLRYTKAAWAIIERWPEDSPRWAWVQDGSVPAEMAFDVCGYLPLTCSLDEAPAYIERELRSYTPEQYTAVRHAVQHWNDVVQDQQLETTMRDAVENALASNNDVSPGISTPIVADLQALPPPVDKMAAARAAKAAKKAQVKS